MDAVGSATPSEQEWSEDEAILKWREIAALSLAMTGKFMLGKELYSCPNRNNEWMREGLQLLPEQGYNLMRLRLRLRQRITPLRTGVQLPFEQTFAP